MLLNALPAKLLGDDLEVVLGGHPIHPTLHHPLPSNHHLDNLAY